MGKSLQQNVELTPAKMRAGLQYSSANATTTRSAVFAAQSGITFDPLENIPGLFLDHGATAREALRLSTNTQLNSIFGVCVDNKYLQNAPASYGGTVKFAMGDPLMMMTQGAVVVQTRDTLGVDESTLYVVTSDNASRGKLVASLATGETGILVGGASFAFGTGNFAVPPVRVYAAEDGLAVVEIAFM